MVIDLKIHERLATLGRLISDCDALIEHICRERVPTVVISAPHRGAVSLSPVAVPVDDVVLAAIDRQKAAYQREAETLERELYAKQEEQHDTGA